MINNFLTTILFLVFSFTPSTTVTHIDPPAATEASAVTTVNETGAKAIYSSLNANSFALPQFECFAKALKGYNELKAQGKIKKDLLTVIDFSKSSNTKRLWVIDMDTKTILYNTLVSHGRNSGNEFATTFSNDANSNKSSLGFYATGEIYTGKHGQSLRLDGLEKGINSNARARAIVMHAADYVSEKFIKQYDRLGRSLGCPAIPAKLNKEIISLIQGKSCLFIYYPAQKYFAASKLFPANAA